MESQLQRPSHDHHHQHEEDPQNAGLHSVLEDTTHEGDHEHGEKKSVLKKVKDKAKKIKDTIKKHGHHHGHEHEHEHDDDEGEDDDEEMVNDPDVHGAPMYESIVIRSINVPKETSINPEKPTYKQDDRHEHSARDEVRISRPFAARQTAPDLGRERTDMDQPKTEIGLPVVLEDDPNSPNNSPSDVPPSNYQSKVADPTRDGGKEAEVAPLISQLKNLYVDNATNLKPESEERPHAGSQDQFTSQPTPTENRLNLKSLDHETQDFQKSEDKSQETIAGKISSAASAVAGTAISAKNAVATKLGYGGGSHEGPVSSSRKPMTDFATEYAHKMVEKLSPGDEDKALSEAITEMLGKKKGEEEKKPVVGKVTESEEVRARLGPAGATKREGEDALASGANSSGHGVVDRLKDAFGSWLGKSAGVQTAQESVGKSYVSDPGSGGTGVGKGKDAGRRPHEE